MKIPVTRSLITLLLLLVIASCDRDRKKSRLGLFP